MENRQGTSRKDSNGFLIMISLKSLRKQTRRPQSWLQWILTKNSLRKRTRRLQRGFQWISKKTLIKWKGRNERSSIKAKHPPRLIERERESVCESALIHPGCCPHGSQGCLENLEVQKFWFQKCFQCLGTNVHFIAPTILKTQNSQFFIVAYSFWSALGDRHRFFRFFVKPVFSQKSK